jgi:hypothetical protein
MSHEFLSEKYRAVVNDDGLLTVRNGPPVLQKTKFFPDGGVDVQFVTQENAVEDSDKKFLAAKAGAPVFLACHAGGQDWNVDIDCGMQRFNGIKSGKELRIALKNCGFGKAQIDLILKLCKKTPKWDYCPHQYR